MHTTAFKVNSINDLHFEARGSVKRAHLVQFFSDDRAVVKGVTDYVFSGLNAGEGVIIVASGEHNAEIKAALSALEVDINAALRSGQVAVLDAHETLTSFMSLNRPDKKKFDATVGVLIDRMCTAFPLVRVYGEMVDILAGKDNLEAAITLEGFWNDLAHRRSFSLLCGYTPAHLSDGDEQAMIRVCNCHTHLITGTLAN